MVFTINRWRFLGEAMKWIQEELTLAPRKRGVHLITKEVLEALSELSSFRVGMLQLFIKHTSASLAINENADPDVRTDLESYLNHTVREREPYYRHVMEGADDMPAHIKAILVGSGLTIPIQKGRLGLGTWQGIYLLEHRDHGGPRRLIATAFGETS